MTNFHLSDILSITTGRLVSLDHMDGVYNILSYMAGRELYTHELGIYAEKTRPVLFNQYPWLAGITCEGIGEHNLKYEVKKLTDRYGEFHAVNKL